MNAPRQAKMIAAADALRRRHDESKPGATSGCHDITVYPEKDLAAGRLLRQRLPAGHLRPGQAQGAPEVTDAENFSIWHSATFNNAASQVIFCDELGGGVAPTCDAKTPTPKGRERHVRHHPGPHAPAPGTTSRSRAHQTATENCVAHNGSLLPVPGKNIMVQAWYQGGVSIWDFTDPANPGDRLLRPRPDRRAQARRLLVGLLLQRLHLLQRHHQGPGRLRDRRPADRSGQEGHDEGAERPDSGLLLNGPRSHRGTRISSPLFQPR